MLIKVVIKTITYNEQRGLAMSQSLEQDDVTVTQRHTLVKIPISLRVRLIYIQRVINLVNELIIKVISKR